VPVKGSNPFISTQKGRLPERSRGSSAKGIFAGLNPVPASYFPVVQR
jgi:hypothetical protein